MNNKGKKDNLERLIVSDVAKDENGDIIIGDYLDKLKKRDWDAYSFARYYLRDGFVPLEKHEEEEAVEIGVQKDSEVAYTYSIRYNHENMADNITMISNLSENPEVVCGCIYKAIGFPVSSSFCKTNSNKSLMFAQLYLGWNLKLIHEDEGSYYGDELKSLFQTIIKEMNGLLGKEDKDDTGCMKIFQGELGWCLDVEFDNETSWEKLIKSVGYDKIDLLGRYIHGLKEDKSSNGEVLSEKKIIIYYRAIKEFLEDTLKEEVKDDDPRLKNIIKYVLAHELFHAYQDFKADLMELSKHNNYVDYLNVLETAEEVFAIMFIKQYLKDDKVFNLVTELWKRESDVDPSHPHPKAAEVYKEYNKENMPEKIKEHIGKLRDMSRGKNIEA